MKSPTQTHLDAHVHVHITQQLSRHKYYNKCYTMQMNYFTPCLELCVCPLIALFTLYTEETWQQGSMFVGTRGHLGECRKLVSILDGTCIHRCGMDSDLQCVCKVACLCARYVCTYIMCITAYVSFFGIVLVCLYGSRGNLCSVYFC